MSIAQAPSSRETCHATWCPRGAIFARASHHTTTGNSSPFAWWMVMIWTASPPTGRGGSIPSGSFTHSRIRAVTASKSSPSEAATRSTSKQSSRSRSSRCRPFGPNATARPKPVFSRRSRAVSPGGRSKRRRRSSRTCSSAARARRMPSSRVSPFSARARTRSPRSTAKNGARRSAMTATPSSRSATARRASRNCTCSGSFKKSDPPRADQGTPSRSSSAVRQGTLKVEWASTATSP